MIDSGAEIHRTFTLSSIGSRSRIYLLSNCLKTNDMAFFSTYAIRWCTSIPARTEIFKVFSNCIQSADEHYCESRQATAREEFFRLGLIDSVLLHEMTDSSILLTTDLDLYLAAIKEGYQARNFNHFRDVAYI
jgi:hypothetical protein